MSILNDEGFALGVAVFLFGIALGLPNLELGVLGFDFSQFPVLVITVMRLGIIIVALSVGLKPLEKENEGIV